mmetsp:Transcript_22321/g.35629  ORF Transcript_22321/g.35629 Transcript_22321/m.35629 type:complete len:212 (-) Transcript_22321:828-1463(-)
MEQSRRLLHCRRRQKAATCAAISIGCTLGNKPSIRGKVKTVRGIHIKGVILTNLVGMNAMGQRYPTILAHLKMRAGFRAREFGDKDSAVQFHIAGRGRNGRHVVGADRNRIGPVGQARRLAGHIPGHARLQARLGTRFGDLGRVDRRVAEHAGGCQVFGIAVDVGCGAELRDDSIIHQGRFATQQKRLFRLGRGVDHHRSASGKKLGQLLS